MTTNHSRLVLAASIAALLATGSAIWAAERPKVDANGDGAIDFAELQARRSDLTIEQFNAMDKDGNGQLSREEMRAAQSARMQARADARFKELDTNGDGSLSQQELAAQREKAAAERFKKMDTDGDGKLSQEEMNAARQKGMQAFAERRGHMGPGFRGPPGNRGASPAPPAGG